MSAGTNLVDATKSCDESIHIGDMLEKSWDGLTKFCSLHGLMSFWLRGGKSIRLGVFSDSPFILSNCSEIKDLFPSVQ